MTVMTLTKGPTLKDQYYLVIQVAIAGEILENIHIH